MSRRFLAALVLSLGLAVTTAEAQSLGTLRWQLQPFCNVVTLNVNQQGSVYTLDGYDDQCGAGQRAPLVGLATPNPDGTIGFGLNVVTSPGGKGVQVNARITLATLGGSWSDSSGNSGTFAFGANTGGSPRPVPAAAASPIPSTFALLPDGGFLARGTGAVTPIPASGPGFRMMWHPSKAAFRAGNVGGNQWDDVNIGIASTATGAGTTASGAYGVAMGFGATASGEYSMATGSRTTASGSYSAAMGANTIASGTTSTAMGASTTASGTASTAIGVSTTASGIYSMATGVATTASGGASTALGSGTIASGSVSTALGINTRASGGYSTAMGANAIASGDYSTAFGNTSTALGSGSLVAGTASIAGGVDAIALGVRVNANGAGSVVIGSDATAVTTGTFMYGDRSTLNDLTTAGSNEFLVRAAGGTVFYSNAAMTTGAVLLSGTSTWQPVGVSDEHRKTDFRDLDGEQVLSKLAAMPVREWSYTTQDAAIRHVGPTAQDFRAAFGLGESDVRIGSVDADGIALAAVKALEARTRALTLENDDLRARLARLEALLERR